MAFIGLAINIWRDTFGTGGPPGQNVGILDAQNVLILDAQNQFILDAQGD